MKKIFSIICFTALAWICLSPRAAAVDRKDEFSRKLNTFNSIVKELQTGYVDTLDAGKLMDRTIAALLYQIDPFTEYYPADNQDEILSLSQGSYAGIGSVISKRGNEVIIADPYWESPARRSGLRHGDVILAVDGDSVTPATNISDVSRRLRGQAGTKVRVDVRRPYVEDSLLSFEILRENIAINPLQYYGMTPDSIGYIALNTFSESSARDVKAALTDLLRHPGLKGVILDLTDNGGGLLEGAVQIAGLFVPKGTEIVRTRGRNPRDERVYKTTQQPLSTDVPLAILVNNNTASASEIVSGALQDLDRAVIVGERTYGKGLVQTTRPLPYNDLMKLTTARYYIPSGRLIQALDYSQRDEDGRPVRTPDSLTTAYSTRVGRVVRDGGGITPDVVVELPEMNRLLYNIIADNWAFDYATRRYAAHPEAPAPGAVLVDSLVFEEFKATIDPARFKYDRQCETGLDYLREAARIEGYMNDSVAAAFEQLATLLHHNLDQDLDINREDIMKVLDGELASRYYPESECRRRQIKDVKAVQEATAILLDPERYRAILAPAAQNTDR